MALLSAGQLGSGFGALPVTFEERVTLLRQLHHGVVLAGTAGGDGAYRELNRLVRLGLAPGVRAHASDAPPTVLALAATVMENGRFGPGDALEVVAAVRSAVATVALLSSVAALNRPRPTLLQHARSLFPGGRFVVDLSDDRVRSGSEAFIVPEGVHGACLVLAHGDDPTSRQWSDELRNLAPGAPTLELPSLDRRAVPWRATRWAEVSVLGVPVHQFAAELDARLVRQQCASCGFYVSSTTCPLCGVVCRPPSAAAEAAARARDGVRLIDDPDATPPAGIRLPGPAHHFPGATNHVGGQPVPTGEWNGGTGR